MLATSGPCVHMFTSPLNEEARVYLIIIFEIPSKELIPTVMMTNAS